MNELNYFELAGYSKEESDKLIKICHECGISYDIVLNALKTFKKPKDIDRLIREYNSLGHI